MIKEDYVGKKINLHLTDIKCYFILMARVSTTEQAENKPSVGCKCNSLVIKMTLLESFVFDVDLPYIEYCFKFCFH